MIAGQTAEKLRPAGTYAISEEEWERRFGGKDKPIDPANYAQA